MKLGGWLTAVLTELLLLGIAVGYQRGQDPNATAPGVPPTVKQHEESVHRGHEKLKEDQHDKKHIEEDLGLSKEMEDHEYTDEELEFRYFIAHDKDNNQMLDGLELLAAIQHNLNEKEEEGDPKSSLDKVIGWVDEILTEEDKNNDGFLCYSEYVAARNKS
ncbi:multiple coagulation factor deficiency protein 2 homolog [Daktulosphaira vitifoliae]|uniref:multiple coagulation factor deficiency protein 2 homolog n=1 Tax=Daktulosphaira vitifoliae TaxID=58002 RepID=UPI0021AAE7FC|nr:multiple coagulation factor deficiency protein 2 homolog [Daktulosphaira vitifoliae]XP_050524297.1 multiple coagulation factor deficiency protein 2 homolog [Daktulosphaira vitifoliae]XP_050524298.1 multiple coagulation factor deficiency protein 2 homolog [Daktulosphaira vitifoliae]